MSADPSLLPEYAPVQSVSVAAPPSQLAGRAGSSDADDAVYIFEIALSKPSLPSPDTAGALLATSSSDGTIKLFDQASLTLLGNLAGHPSAPISRVVFAHTNPSLLFSAGLDGAVHCWDVRAASLDASTSAPVVSFYGGQKVHFSSMDVSCDDGLVVAGGEQIHDDQGPVLIWDARNAASTLHAFTESHTDDVASIECHPTRPQRFVTGSEDNLVCLFDLSANMSTEIPADMVVEDEITPEENATVSVMNAESSVHKVGFFGPDGEYIYVQTGSQTLRLYEGESARQLASFSMVRELINDYFMASGSAMHVDYLITSRYCPSTQRLFLMGGDFEGTTHILHVSLSGFQYVRSLSGLHTSTIRSIDWSDDLSTVYAAGEDSLLSLWKS